MTLSDLFKKRLVSRNFLILSGLIFVLTFGAGYLGAEIATERRTNREREAAGQRMEEFKARTARYPENQQSEEPVSQTIVDKALSEDSQEFLEILEYMKSLENNPSMHQTEDEEVEEVADANVVQGVVKEIPASCRKTFSSTYLELAFDYDGCLWTLEEGKRPEGYGEEWYSSNPEMDILASHVYGGEVDIRFEVLGMGGGYPSCFVGEEIVILPSDIYRIRREGEYRYYTQAHSINIRGYDGKIGNEEFEEWYYVGVIPGSSASPNPGSNMCGAFHGTYAIPQRNWEEVVARMYEESLGDYSFEEFLSDNPAVGSRDISAFVTEATAERATEAFLQDVDTLIFPLYTGIEKYNYYRQRFPE